MTAQPAPSTRARFASRTFHASGSQRCSSAIHAAVLALDGNELLRRLTPTTSIAAIRIRHEAELLAECHFAGVALSGDGVRDRFHEVEREVREIWPGSEDFPPVHVTSFARILRASLRELRYDCRDFLHCDARMRDSALAGIVSRLLSTVDGRHQLEAELELLREDRRLRNRVRWYQNREDLPHDPRPAVVRGVRFARAIVEYAGIRYVNWLLTGLDRLMLASVFWLLLLAYPLMEVRRPRSDPHDRDVIVAVTAPQLEAVQYSFTTFFGIGQPNATGQDVGHVLWFLVVGATMVIGLFHVGILISHLYTVASRR